MKICIISYYGLRDSLLCAAQSLEKLGHTVIDYPLLYEKNTFPDYINNYKKFIDYASPNLILWWFIGIDTTHFIDMVKISKVKQFYFNWDDPFNWESCDLENKSKYLDCAFVCSEAYLDKYQSKKTIYLLPGFSDKINYVLSNNHLTKGYDCDISFICTNLYSDNNLFPDQYINRKILIDEIYKNQYIYNYTFNIYGPSFLSNLYPGSYKGYIKYDDQNLLFNKSKINLTTHVSYINNKYTNERTIMIAGSGGLLLTDPVKGFSEIFDPNSECIFLDKEKYIRQIVDILDNYDDYYDRRVAIYNKSKLYSWDRWASTIHVNL